MFSIHALTLMPTDVFIINNCTSPTIITPKHMEKVNCGLTIGSSRLFMKVKAIPLTSSPLSRCCLAYQRLNEDGAAICLYSDKF